MIRNRLLKGAWQDDLRAKQTEYIKNKGLEKISIEDIVQEIAPRGRATIPDSLRADVFVEVKEFARQKGIE